MATLYQALVTYATERNLLARPYYADLRVAWQLDLHGDGSLANPELTPLGPDLDKNGQPSKIPGLTLSVPSMKRTSGVRAILGADGLDYVLGWFDHSPDDPAADEKARSDSLDRHAAWTTLTRTWATHPLAADDRVPGAVVRFLEEGVERVQRPEKWAAKDRVVVRVDGKRVTESPSASDFWAQHVESSKASDRRGPCLVCGRHSSLVATLPQSVKGTLIPDGHTSGVAPISINEAVYGFDLRKGLGHVPVCISCAQAIPVALEHLLTGESRSHRTPRSASTWWIEGGDEFDPTRMLTPPSDHDVKKFIDRVAGGRGTEHALHLEEFHALTLEANGPRMVVRDWTHLPIATLQDNILQWFADTRVVPTWPSGREYQSLGLLAMATGRHDSKLNQYRYLSDRAGRHPHAITETLRSVALRSVPLPRTVLAHLLQRVLADGHMDDPRAALLRLFFARSNMKGSFMPGLDPTNQDPSYLLGRLMAVYEGMQYSAATINSKDGAPNATFADKFMAGAITSPLLVLTSGGKQALAWRAKLRRANKGYFYDKTIDAITDLLTQSEPPPTRATIEEQGSFLLGYHHQRAHDRHRAEKNKATKDAALMAEDPAASKESDE